MDYCWISKLSPKAPFGCTYIYTPRQQLKKNYFDSPSTSRAHQVSGFLNFLQLDVKSFSLLLEDKKSKTSSYAELDHPRFKKKATKWIAVLVRNRTRNSQKWFQTKTARNWRFFTSIVKPKNFLEILERFWGQGLQNLAPSSFISRNFLSHFTQALKSGWLFFFSVYISLVGEKAI